jgi:pimeloyl-ACP methyl ester carboxylesterase
MKTIVIAAGLVLAALPAMGGQGVPAKAAPYTAATGMAASAEDDAVTNRVVDLVTEDKHRLWALLYTNGTPASIGIVIMHPRSDSRRDWRLTYFANAGIAALGMASRHENSSEEERYEDIMLDIASGVKYLREKVGVKKVFLLGHSGGGSLMTFYANQSGKKPGERVTGTFTGMGPDLNKFELPPVDLLICSANHFGNQYTTVRKIDPSVTDENDPTSVDPELDMYNPANGFRQPPESSHYSKEFLEKFDKAQHARWERLTQKALSIFRDKQLYKKIMESPGFANLDPYEQIQIRRKATARHYMKNYRFTAIPEGTDLSIDKTDREVGLNSSPRPDWDNYASNTHPSTVPVETFLDTNTRFSNVYVPKNIKEVTIPTLFITGTADMQEYPAERDEMFKASGAKVKKVIYIEGANHPYLPQGPKAGDGKQRDRAADAMLQFIKENLQ